MVLRGASGRIRVPREMGTVACRSLPLVGMLVMVNILRTVVQSGETCFQC
jgi:hypothetical protein